MQFSDLQSPKQRQLTSWCELGHLSVSLVSCTGQIDTVVVKFRGAENLPGQGQMDFCHISCPKCKIWSFKAVKDVPERVALNFFLLQVSSILNCFPCVTMGMVSVPWIS